MSALIVIENPKAWPLDVPGVEVVPARQYLVDPRYTGERAAKVFNLCRSYRYQSVGYYVSLLATARGHKPMPSVQTIQDLKLSPVVRVASGDLEEVMHESLKRLRRKRFELFVYFGRSVVETYDRLAQAIFNQFPAPFLRASFTYDEEWALDGVRPIATSEIDDDHHAFVLQRAKEYFAKPRMPTRQRAGHRYDMAILADEDEKDPPSNERALQRFVRAARQVGIGAEVIGKDEYGRIGEFDALFIRETTWVNHHTYRFASRAEAEGLVVIDDPESIVRCSNKVYLAELFNRHSIPSPRTMVVHRDNISEVIPAIGLPCVLKRPDSSFSKGVLKAADEAEFARLIEKCLEDSELAIAQEFVPSAFDWRIGVINRKPLFACKYHMVPGHWQVISSNGAGERKYGRVETLPLYLAPPKVVSLALKCAGFIGDGLYGVDIKDVDGKYMVMEVNDNPNIDAGIEDAVARQDLYLSVMRVFRDRLDARGMKGWD